jgi:chromosome segregation ATPase
MAGKKGISKKVKVIAILVLLPLGILIPAFSIRSYHLPLTNAQTQEETQELRTRKQQYADRITDDVSTSEQERIKTRCLAVQTNIKALATRISSVQENRSKKYDAISENLTTLEKKLDNQAFNTTKLSSSIKELDNKISTYKTTMKDYKQAIDDMTVIDCSKDPVAFRGALEAARTKHAELITQVGDIREYVVNTVKPQLQQIRQALAEGRTAGGA